MNLIFFNFDFHLPKKMFKCSKINEKSFQMNASKNENVFHVNLNPMLVEVAVELLKEIFNQK